jgi:hypothetical protein
VIFVALICTIGNAVAEDSIPPRPVMQASAMAYDLPVAGGDFSVTLARLRLSYSFTPKILLQLLMQYNNDDDTFSTNLRFFWLRTASTGLYLVYNEYDENGVGALPTGREIILK